MPIFEFPDAQREFDSASRFRIEYVKYNQGNCYYAVGTDGKKGFCIKDST